MKRSEVNTDPERARKRAKSDLRCAVRKLGVVPTIETLIEVLGPDTDAGLVLRLFTESAEWNRAIDQEAQ